MNAYCLEVLSLDDPDTPIHVAHFEAADHDAAHELAVPIVVEHGGNPELHWGDLWVHIEPTARAEYVMGVAIPVEGPA